MREIRQSGSEGGAMQTNVSFLPLSNKGVVQRSPRAGLAVAVHPYGVEKFDNPGPSIGPQPGKALIIILIVKQRLTFVFS